MTTNQLMQLVCNKFTLLENAVCGDSKRRQARSIPTAIKTSIAKEESSRLITTRNAENNREAVTYARGNSVTMTTCSMMMTVTMTLLLLTSLLY